MSVDFIAAGSEQFAEIEQEIRSLGNVAVLGLWFLPVVV